MLAIKLEPYSDECWAGYLLRLANANHLKGLDELARVVNVTPTVLLYQSEANRYEVKEALLARSQVALELRPKTGVRPINGGYSRYARVCPCCLSEDSYLRADWSRSLRMNCKAHACALLDRCPNCSGRIEVERENLTRCACGYDFTTSAAQSLIIGEESVIELLDLREEYAEPAKMFGATTKRELAALHFVFRYLTISSRNTLHARGACPKLNDPLFELSQLADFSRGFQEWPVQFDRTIHDFAQRSRKGYAYTFSGLWRKDPTCLPSIRRQIAKLKQARVRSGLRRPGKVLQTPLEASSSASISQIMRLARCSYDVVQHWLSNGALSEAKEALPTKRRGRPGKQYDAKAAQTFCTKMASLACVPETSGILEVSTTAVRTLIRTKALETVSFGAAKWNVRIVRESLYRLAERVLSRCILVETIETKVVALDSILISSGMQSSKNLHHFLSAVESGEVKLYLQNNATYSWGSIWVDAADNHRWREKHYKRWMGRCMHLI